MAHPISVLTNYRYIRMLEVQAEDANKVAIHQFAGLY